MSDTIAWKLHATTYKQFIIGFSWCPKQDFTIHAGCIDICFGTSKDAEGIHLFGYNLCKE